MCVYLSVLVCVFEYLGDADDVGVWLFLRTWDGVTWDGRWGGGGGGDWGKGEGGCHVSMWDIFPDQCKKGWVGVANGPKHFSP